MQVAVIAASCCVGPGGHWLQLVLVAFFLQPLAQTVLALVVFPLVATCADGLFPSTDWYTYSTCARAACTVWWWSVMMVVVYEGGSDSCSYVVVVVQWQ